MELNMKELSDNMKNLKKIDRKNFFSVIGLTTLSVVIIKSLPFNGLFKNNTNKNLPNNRLLTQQQMNIKINPLAVKRNIGEKNG